MDGVSRRRETELAGRTSGNTIVNFPGDGLAGRLVDVRITEAGPNSLQGELASPVAATALANRTLAGRDGGSGAFGGRVTCKSK